MTFHEIAYESDSLVFRPDPSLPVCAGSIDFMEAFIDHQAAMLPSDVSFRGPITYQYLTRERTIEACEFWRANCAYGGHAFSIDAVDQHELVHAVRIDAYDGLEGAQILEEGLAVLYSTYQSSDERKLLSADELELWVLERAMTRDEYYSAGHFMSFLHQTIGPEALQRFTAATEAVKAVSDYAEIYAATTGRDWDDDVAAYHDYPLCPAAEYVQRPMECGPEARSITLDRNIRRAVEFVDFGCGHPDAIGPRLGKAWGMLALDVPGDERVTVDFAVSTEHVFEPGDLIVEIASCVGACGAGYTFVTSHADRSALTLELDPGRYTFRVGLPVEVTTWIEVSAWNLGPV